MTLHGASADARRDPDVEIATAAPTAWLDTMSAWQKRNPRDAALYARLVGMIDEKNAPPALRGDARCHEAGAACTEDDGVVGHWQGHSAWER